MTVATEKQITFINDLIAQNAKSITNPANDYGKFLAEFWSKVQTPEGATVTEASELIDFLRSNDVNMIATKLAGAIKNGKTDHYTALFGKFNKPAVKFLKNALANAQK